MSSLYTPEKISDLYFNKECAEKLKVAVQAKQPTLLYGPPGVGKTTSVHVVSKELCLNLVEINASDDRGKLQLQRILDRVKSRSLIPSMYLLDEIDGVHEFSILEKIITQSKSPVVLIANDIYHIPETIKNRCTQLKYQVPTLVAITELVKAVSKKRGFTPKFDTISKGTDFRSALLSAAYGGQSREPSDPFKSIEHFIRDGVIPDGFNSGDIDIWLLDNASTFMRSVHLVEYVNLISKVSTIPDNSIVDKYDILSQIRADHSGRVTYPNFFKRAALLKRKKKVEQE